MTRPSLCVADGGGETTPMAAVPSDGKRCTGCGECKPRSAFSKNAAAKDGLQTRCRACYAANQAAYYAANREKFVAQQAAYRAANQEKIAANQAAYYAANREKKAAYDANRRSAGKCLSCAKRDSDSPGGFCRPCWFRRTATNRTGSAKNAPSLEAQWLKQGGRCAWTDNRMRIEPGSATWDSASVEHRVAPKKGGSESDPSNLLWVCNQVNTAKGQLSEHSFYRLCSEVTYGPRAVEFGCPSLLQAVLTAQWLGAAPANDNANAVREVA